MRAVEVDERDSSWEDYQAVYRVYFFHGAPRVDAAWATTTYDVHDADVVDVAEWARERAGEDYYAVALVSERETPGGHAKGLTWLIGSDLNDAELDEHEARLIRRMKERHRSS